MSSSIPAKGRLAGIDYGTVRVGIAVCDSDRILSSPFETYTRQNEESDAEYFRAFVASETIVAFIVGLPIHNSGDESQKSLEARQFGRWLRQLTELPVAFVDERFSTAMAKNLMGDAQLTRKKRKARIDKLAAQIILSSYLESPSNSEPLPLED